MTQKKKGKYTCRMCLHCDAETAALLERMAISEKTTRSEIIRRMLEKGARATGFQEDEAQLQARVTASVREVMKPYIERLAAISAKSAQISGAAFFMNAYVFSLLLPEDRQTQIVNAAVRAHRAGTEFAKSKGSRELDDFIQEALFAKDQPNRKKE
jgi:hypothetical protein